MLLQASEVNAEENRKKAAIQKQFVSEKVAPARRFRIFFACTYLYVLLVIEPRLIYHSFGNFITYPAFSVDWEFLRNSLSYPGGIVEYAGGFLSQLYYFSWLGALVITAIALLIYIATRILIRLSTTEKLKLLCYIPVVFLLMSYNRYDIKSTHSLLYWCHSAS